MAKAYFYSLPEKKRHIRSPANLAKRSGSCEPSTQPVCQPSSPARGLFPKAQRPAPLVGKACVESARGKRCEAKSPARGQGGGDGENGAAGELLQRSRLGQESRGAPPSDPCRGGDSRLEPAGKKGGWRTLSGAWGACLPPEAPAAEQAAGPVPFIPLNDVTI